MSNIFVNYFETPKREYLLSILLLLALVLNYTLPGNNLVYIFVWVATILGSIPLLIFSIKALVEFKITIEVFNLFALGIALAINNTTAALWIELMLLFAAYLEWRTKSRAKNAIEELLKLAPEIAHKEIGENKYEDILPTEVLVGDIVLVKTGEKIPVDGKIIFGDAVLDESSFTGESLPVEKSVGSKVFTSTILTSGVIKIQTEKTGEDTSFYKMVSLMREALKAKSKFHKFADIFATLFLPMIAVIALVIYFVTKDSAVVAAFLVIVCADDIAVAIPLAMEAAFGKAASMGVIVKGGLYFERLAEAKVVVFDKTGTVTQSKIKVDHYGLSEGIGTLQFWQSVSVAEKFSEHPIGITVYNEALKYKKQVPDPDEIKVLTGAGVFVKYGTDSIVIGNTKAMNEYSVKLDDSIVRRIVSYRGKTVLFVALNGIQIGYLVLSDSVKDNAFQAIAKLKSLGLKTIILTGDKKDVADAIGAEIGVDEIYSELSPEDKLRIVTELSDKQAVVMVGDGVNDAPALARADVGIAMGEIGMAASVEAADVVIQTDNLMRIYDLLVLAKRIKRVILNNFAIWFITNMIGTVLVLTKTAGIAVAAFYNFGTDFIPLFNSAWLFKKEKPDILSK